MDDPTFWRDAAQRFLACDPRGKINLDWTPQGASTSFSFGNGEGTEEFMRIAVECGRRLNSDATYHLEEWLNALIAKPDRFGNRFVVNRTAKGQQSGWLEDVSDASSKLCKIFESESYEATPLHQKDAPAEAAWAVCPRYLQRDDRRTQFFNNEIEAREFHEAEAIHLRATGAQPIDRKVLGWQAPVPVSHVVCGLECPQTFREFYPPEDIPQTMPGFSTDEAIDRVFAGRHAEIACFLGSDWYFADIDRDAWKRQGHEFSGRARPSVAAIIVYGIYDFDRALRAAHPGITCGSVASFFTSWQFWRHVADFCIQVGESSIAGAVAGHAWAAIDQATNTRDRLYEQFLAYAHEIRQAQTVTPALQESSRAAPSSMTRQRIEGFIDGVRAATGQAINKTDIWRVAGYTDRTEFERFQRDDARTTVRARGRFEEILTLDPHVFIERLKRAR